MSRVWPFKKKSKKATPLEGALQALKDFQFKKLPPCPEKRLFARDCICIDCTKCGKCSIELACRSSGCDSYSILTCSIKSSNKPDAPSEFGELIIHQSIKRVFKELTVEAQDELRKDMKKRELLERKEEVANGKEETGTTSGDGPRSNM